MIKEHNININEILPDILMSFPGNNTQTKLKSLNNVEYGSLLANWEYIRDYKDNAIGIHVLINFSLSDSEALLIASSDSNNHSNRNFVVEFRYNEIANAYYLRNNKLNKTLFKASTASLKKTVTHNYDEINLIQPKLKMNFENDDSYKIASKIPKFYMNLIPAIKRISDSGYENELLTFVLGKKNYAEDIETYRVTTSGLVRVPEEDERVTIIEDALIEERSISKNAKNDAQSQKMLQQSLKNRKSIKKAIRTLATPANFIWLIAILGLGAFVAIVISCTQYVIYDSLFYKIQSQIETFYYIPDQYISIMEPVRYVIQAISVNEYFF